MAGAFKSRSVPAVAVVIVLQTALVRQVDTVPAPSDNCLLSGDAGRGCDWYKIVRMTPDTKTCDACGTRYAFTSHKDRCPVCCPVEDKDNESPDEYDQTDFSDPTERKREWSGEGAL